MAMIFSRLFTFIHSAAAMLNILAHLKKEKKKEDII